VLVESASFFHKELQKMSVLVKSILILLASSSVDVLTPTSGAKILFLPAIVDSHVLYLSRLAADLAELGHTTTVVATANARVPDFVAEISGGNFNYKEYTVNYAGRRCGLGSCQTECDALEARENDYVKIHTLYGGFQFVVLDHHPAPCFSTIPYELGIPYGTFFTSSYSSTYL